MIDYFVWIAVGVLVIEFAVKRLLDVYLYVKERLNEKVKRGH